MTPRPCPVCDTPIARVTTSIDPQEVAHVFTAGCGHQIDPDVAAALWRDGYRWTVPVIDGASLFAAERDRHVNVEGFTAEHDATHGPEGLPWAAWSYVDAAVNDTGATFVEPPTMWPWHADRWKVEATPLRRLIIAGSLLAAEIDRRLLADRAIQHLDPKGNHD